MRRNAQLKIALDLSMGRERFNCQENCKVAGRGSYAQGSATCGIRMPVKSCCSHKNHCPVEDSQEPRLLVFDVSRVMAVSWKKGIAAITKILKVWMMCGEPQVEPIWLFLNIDPYGFELSDSESWECLERIVKDKEFKVKPVFLTKGKTEREINERLHIKA